MDKEMMKQFHGMKARIKQNAPSKDDVIPMGSQYRSMLLMKHRFTAQQHNKQMLENDNFLQLQTNSDPISCNHLCMKHENELKNAFISDLRINQINIGKKLTVKVVADVMQTVSINTVVEDKEGNVLLLAMYNFAPLRSSPKQLSKLLPIGTTLVIKEPYVKKSVAGSVAIRIDNIHKNVIVKHPNDPKFICIKEKDVCKLKEIGNAHFKKQNYRFAMRHYSEALLTADIDGEMKGKLLGNRALCYLKIEKYLEAVQDAQHALDLDKSSIKLRYRLATALTGIRRHAQALSVLLDVETLTQSPSILRF